MLDIYYQNLRGMRTKTNAVFNNIMQNKYDVIAFTETWLNSNVNNGEFIDTRYNVYRRDRTCSLNSKKRWRWSSCCRI